jgi:hypothetical protein
MARMVCGDGPRVNLSRCGTANCGGVHVTVLSSETPVFVTARELRVVAANADCCRDEYE